MKQLFLILFLITNFSSFAQANREEVRKLLRINGAEYKYDNFVKNFSKSLPESKKALFENDVKLFTKKYIENEVTFYAQEFSQDEIAKLIEFYESPLGKKYVEKNIELNHITRNNSNKYLQDLQGIIMKYMF